MEASCGLKVHDCAVLFALSVRPHLQDILRDGEDEKKDG
jgi:hypothetical protein